MAAIGRLLPAPLDLRYLQVLTDITSLLLRDDPPDVFCEAVFSKLQSVLQLDVYFHFRVTPDGTRMTLASSRGCPPERRPEVEFLEFGQAVCGTVAATRTSMYVPRVPECVNELTAFVYSIGVTCYTCQPLIVNGRLLGTFSFGTRSRTEYNEQELQLIRLVCDQVAIATQRAIDRQLQLNLERMAVAGQMAAKIAHEINNPLSAATNILYLLGTMSLPPETQEYLEIAQEQLNRIAGITRQMLSYYRESHKPAPVRVRHTTESVLAAAAYAALQKRVKFHIDVPRDMTVHAVDSELAQILTNLVANAIHFSPEHETIGIAAFQRDRKIEIFVSDRGPGVRAEHASKLFQPFFTTNKTGGNGLGLWISRELARRVNGDLVFVPSEQGATFKLLLQPVA